MDTKDREFEASSGAMAPDSTMSPMAIEHIVEADGALRTVAPETGTIEVELTPEGKPKKSPTPLQDSLRRLRRDKRAMISLGFILLFIVIPIVGPPIYTHIGGLYNSPLNGLIGPAKYHS